MPDPTVRRHSFQGFVQRWEASGASERANYSMFLNEMCDLLEVPPPDPAGPDDEKNAYVFERAVPFPKPDGSTTEAQGSEAQPVEASKRTWPKTLPEQAQAVRAALADNPAGLTAEQVARLFVRASAPRVAEILETLVSLGQARRLEGERYIPG
jgi:hypothetical protein